MLVELGSTFTFGVNTKNSSGVITAPDGGVAPTYKVFEGGTALLTGSMTAVSGETGFYIATITASAGNGFDRGSTYIIRSTWTVTSTFPDLQSFTVV